MGEILIGFAVLTLLGLVVRVGYISLSLQIRDFFDDSPREKKSRRWWYDDVGDGDDVGGDNHQPDADQDYLTIKRKRFG